MIVKNAAELKPVPVHNATCILRNFSIKVIHLEAIYFGLTQQWSKVEKPSKHIATILKKKFGILLKGVVLCTLTLMIKE